MKQTEILQVRPFTQEGRCQMSVKMFLSCLYQFMESLDLQQDTNLYLQQMQKITNFSGHLHWAFQFYKQYSDCTEDPWVYSFTYLSRENEMLKKPFLLLLTDCFICKFSVLQPLEEGSVVLIIIFTIIAFSIQLYIFYIFQILYITNFI